MVLKVASFGMAGFIMWAVSLFPCRRRRAASLLIAVAALAGSSCAELGYRNRVLVRSPSPDGQVIAVCQEIPEFDGPRHEIRLERPDGSRIRTLLSGAGCTEIAWSADGRLAAVLSGFLVNVAIADVAYALEHPSEDLHRVQYLQLGAGPPPYDKAYYANWRAQARVGQNVRFVSSHEIAYDSCTFADRDIEHERQTHLWRCAGPVESRTAGFSPALAYVAERR